VLFYVALFAAVHFEAKRKNIGSVSKEDHIPIKDVLSERGHLFLPLIVITQATIGMILLAAVLQRYFFGRMNWITSTVLFAASLCLIYPDVRIPVVGLAIAGGVLALQKMRHRDMVIPNTAHNTAPAAASNTTERSTTQ